MVIKKPYAFLIKHFRVIHLILALFMFYLLTKSNQIFIFFNNYVKNGYYDYSADITFRYVNFYMFISIILILLLTSFIYLLMRWKKKNRKFYVFTILFYFLIFIGLLFFFNIFNNILNSSYDPRIVRAYRDVAAMVYFPQYIFLIFATIRAVGFNIKQFDFKKDLLDLDIAEEDQEEIEVTFNDNSYKVKRWFRRQFRETKYYILENKFFFTVIFSVFFITVGSILYFRFGVYDKVYTEAEFFSVDGVVFSVKESFITNIDLNGNIINGNKNYLIVKVSMKNNNNFKTTLDTDSIRLRLNNENYYPIYSKSDYFKDLGEGYYKNILYPADEHEYLVIYEIPNELDYNGAIFRMVNSINVKDGAIDAKYRDVKLHPIEYLEEIYNDPNNLNEMISLDNTTLKNTEVIFNSYEIGDQFSESFTYCVNTCLVGKKLIKPSLVGKANLTILKVNLDSSLDESLYINKYIKNNSDFMEYFSYISYKINGKTKIVKPTVVSLENIETNNVYLEMDEEIKNATHIEIILNIRNSTYSVILK